MFAKSQLLRTAAVAAIANFAGLITSASPVDAFCVSPGAMFASNPPGYALEVKVQQSANPGELRMDVSTYALARPADKTQVAALWYVNGKPVAYEQLAPLSIPPNENVSINIIDTPCPSFLELKAAANALCRLALKATLNRNKLQSVKVSNAAFNLVAQELQFRNLKIAPTDEPPASRLSFRLQDESSRHFSFFY